MKQKIKVQGNSITIFCNAIMFEYLNHCTKHEVFH